MAAIGRLGMDAVELTYALREVRIRRLDDEVISFWGLLSAHRTRQVLRPTKTDDSG